MSRLAKKPLKIVGGVNVEEKDRKIIVKGSKGELTMALHPSVKFSIEEGFIIVEGTGATDKTSKSIVGTTLRLINNMMIGVSEGFKKSLELVGVGYKVQVEGKNLKMSLGFSHPILFEGTAGVDFAIDEKNKNMLHITGVDKQLVGQVAANIRVLKKPEPYKGKGIKYVGEVIRRKSSKGGV